MDPFLMHSHEIEQSRYQERLAEAELQRQIRAARAAERQTTPRGPVRMPVQTLSRLLRAPVRAVARQRPVY